MASHHSLQLKASFSFPKIIPKALKCIYCILICHCTSLSPWFIILDKNYFVKVTHHYWISTWAPMYIVCLNGDLQWIQSADSIHVINIFTSGELLGLFTANACGLIGKYWAKCKQSNSHTSLTTLCPHFLLSYVNQTMTKSAHWWSWSYDLHGWSGGVFVSRKYSRRLYRVPQKFISSI